MPIIRDLGYSLVKKTLQFADTNIRTNESNRKQIKTYYFVINTKKNSF